MYKQDFALNNLQWLICYKTKPKQNKGVILMLIIPQMIIMIISGQSSPAETLSKE